jgi:[ribosomal protein S5]-alanine N-acetyltransferase
MSDKIKPSLGQIAAFTINTPDLQQSLAFYNLLGFSEVMRADWPFPWIQVSDGVLLIMLRQDPQPYIALTYYVSDIEKVAANLEKAGIVFDSKPATGDVLKRFLFRSPDCVTISLVSMVKGFVAPAGKTMLQIPQENYGDPATYPNKVAGLFGEFAHPVKDIHQSIEFWKLLGFEGVSEFESPYPWAILTDGLTVIGLHQSAHFDFPAITFFAADMELKISQLKTNGLKDFTDQGRGNMIAHTPEGQHIFMFQLGEPPASATLDSIGQITLETPRLLLREISPEIMHRLFADFTDNEIKTFLGLVSDEELEVERNNFRLGLTTYRISFKAFLIQEKSTGRTIGKAGYHNWYAQHARAELGYAIYDDLDKNKGYMKEALTAIIEFGFSAMNLNRIEAMIGTHNVPSLKLVEGFGFTREGVLRSHYFKNGVMEDSVCFSLLRKEYMPE